MSKYEIIRISMVVCSAIIALYMLVDLYIKKRKYEKKEIKQIKCNKYMVCIVIIAILYIIYGILRNIR